LDTCHTHQEPVNGDEKRPLYQVKLLALQTSKQVAVDIEKVAEYQTDHTCVEYRSCENEMVITLNARAEYEESKRDDPEQRIEEERGDFPAEYKLDREQIARLAVANHVQRM